MAALARARERRSAPEAVFSPISRISSAGGFVSSSPWLTEFIHATWMNIAYALRCGEVGMFLCSNFRAETLTLSDGPCRKPRSIFPSRRAYRFALSTGEHAPAAPECREDRHRCRASAWQMNGAARAD